MSKYFSDDETTCKCGCGGNYVTNTLMELLDDIREEVGRPVYLSCAYRCPEHNEEVGGVPNSQHTQGTAADILVPEGMTVDELADIAVSKGADGVGRYYNSEFVHVDVRDGRSWSDIEWEE